jgi:hypothetical protein
LIDKIARPCYIAIRLGSRQRRPPASAFRESERQHVRDETESAALRGESIA